MLFITIKDRFSIIFVSTPRKGKTYKVLVQTLKLRHINQSQFLVLFTLSMIFSRSSQNFIIQFFFFSQLLDQLSPVLLFLGFKNTTILFVRFDDSSSCRWLNSQLISCHRHIHSIFLNQFYQYFSGLKCNLHVSPSLKLLRVLHPVSETCYGIKK